MIIPGRAVMVFFSAPPHPDRLQSPASLLYSRYRGLLARRFKWSGREYDHKPPLSAAVKNAGNHAYTPKYVFMASCLFKHRDIGGKMKFGERYKL